jgi:hypothetical protein
VELLLGFKKDRLITYSSQAENGSEQLEAAFGVSRFVKGGARLSRLPHGRGKGPPDTGG